MTNETTSKERTPTPEYLEELLVALLDQVRDAEGDDTPMGELADNLGGIRHILTFAEAGVLTRDRGVVLRTGSGDEFQITIVRSR